jgi:hypothetical protein
MPEFLASFTPEDLSTWGAALAGLVGVMTLALMKAAPAWAEIRRQLDFGGDESLAEMVKEIRDLVKDHESRLVDLEAQADRPSKPLALVSKGLK